MSAGSVGCHLQSSRRVCGVNSREKHVMNQIAADWPFPLGHRVQKSMQRRICRTVTRLYNVERRHHQSLGDIDAMLQQRRNVISNGLRPSVHFEVPERRTR